MQPSPKPGSLQIAVILAIAVLAVSTAAVWIRLALQAAGTSGVGFSLFLAASRLSIAALVLLPAWRAIALHPPSPSAFRYAVAAGACLAVHFATWITSLSFTSIAASTALVTTNPFWVALLSWLWLGEKPRKLTILGIAIALGGGFLIALGSAGNGSPASHPLLGNLLALLGAIMASFYFLLGREAQRRGLGTGSYAAIAYSSSALLLLPLPVLLGAGYRGYPPLVYLYILLMALMSQIIGHTGINWTLRWFSPTLVTLAILLEPVGSSLLGFIIFGEVPGNWTIAGAALLLGGVAISVLGAADL